MKGFIGVTDNDWFTFLSQQPEIDEVNFWQPGGKTRFRSLSPGEPFFFKLHAPHHFIVGGGFFTHSTILPISLAWSAFGEKNGASSLAEMRTRTEHYRRVRSLPTEDYKIGCILLTQPFFFKRKESSVSSQYICMLESNNFSSFPIAERLKKKAPPVIKFVSWTFGSACSYWINPKGER